MNRAEQDDREMSSLTKLRLGVQALFTVVFVILFVGVGAAPGKWGLPFGVTMAAFVVYWMFHEDIERHLTGPQEWGLFGLAIGAVILGVVAGGGELSDEVILGFVGAVGVSTFFGYRAVKRR